MAEFIGVKGDDDGLLVPAKRRGSRHSRQGGKQRAHAIDGIVLEFALRVGRTAENQLTYRDAARVEPCNERRHCSWRHEGAGAVHVAYRFRHRLAHVGPRVKNQLHQRRALDAFALDMLDAGDVEEVVLVIEGHVAFHLGGIHAAIGLSHVNRRASDLGKNIDRHALHRQQGEECDGDQGHHHGERSAKSR